MARRMLFPAELMVLIVVLVHEACTGNDSDRHSCPPCCCGNIQNIWYPFHQLDGNPPICGDHRLFREGQMLGGSQSYSPKSSESSHPNKVKKHSEATIHMDMYRPSSSANKETKQSYEQGNNKAVSLSAHFQELETQIALMQNQICTIICTMKEVHYAFHDHHQDHE